jgi:multiple sugar transport system substrate-binding protein
MRPTRFAPALALTALTASTVLAGCAGVGGGGSDAGEGASGSTGGASAFEGAPTGDLRTMGFGGEDEVGQSRVAAFKASAPDVTVKINKGEFDAQQFLTAAASGNPPDLVYMDRNLIGSYAAKKAILPLEDCIAGQQIDTSQYRPAALKSVTFDGKVYAIPEFYIVTVDLIDAKTLASAGLQTADIQTKDWPALEQTATRMYQASGSKLKRVGYDPKLPDSFPLWAQINGAEIIKADGAPNLNDPKAVEALQFAISLVQKQGGWKNFKAFRDAYDIFGEQNPLTVGSIAAFPMENWYVNVLRDSLGKGLKLDAAPITDRSGQPVSTLGGSGWAIPKQAKNPKAACAWMKQMTSKETWLKAAEARMAKVKSDKTFFTGLFTANAPADDEIKAKYLTEAPDPGFQKAIEAFYATLDSAKALNPSPVGAEIDAAWKSGVARALGGQAPQAALDQAQKEAQKAFDKVSGRG